MIPLRSNIPGGRRTILLIALSCTLPVAALQADDLTPTTAGHSVLDIFQDSTWREDSTQSTCSFDFQASGSEWAHGLDEREVFFASVSSETWQLGIGKGGQIYSFRGPFGESVPPQRKEAPWMDEVWQLVGTSEDIVGPIHDFNNKHPEMRVKTAALLYFIHQAGIYLRADETQGEHSMRFFYSPCLRKRWNASNNSLELVNWAQQANSPCVWKSKVLIYSSYRNVGKGVLEINQVMHNFGSERLDFLNVPWGGVRKSSLPNTVLSDGEESFKVVSGTWDWHDIPTRSVSETGGWIGWVQDPKDENSPALALVFGGTNQKEAGDLRWGTAGEKYRDYEVTERILKKTLNPGGSLAVRWFLIAGSFADVRNLAIKAGGKALVGRPTYQSDALQPVWADGTGINTEGSGKIWRELFAFPLPGTVPVFLLEDRSDGSFLVTADPYALAQSQPFPNPLPKEGKIFPIYEDRVVHLQNSDRIGYLNLLGYASTQKSEESPHSLGIPPTAEKEVRIHESARGLWTPR